MKYIIYIGLAFLFNSYNLAQNTKTVIGFDISPSISSLYGSDYLKEFDSRTSFSGGICFDFLLTDQKSVKTGIYYDRKGITSDVYVSPDHTTNFEGSDLTLTYDYITFPVLGTISSKGKTKFFLTAGPSFGFLLYQKWKVGSTNQTREIIADNTSNTNKFDLGLTFGPGISIFLTENLYLSLELRNNIGLINTNKSSSYVEKTRIHSLLIGLRYKS